MLARLVPEKACCPVAIWSAMEQSAKMSARASVGYASRCSGDMY